MLEAFLNRPDASEIDIVAIVRSPEKAKKLRDDFGVETVVGSFSDLPLIEKLASEANVTIAMVRGIDLLQLLRGDAVISYTIDRTRRIVMICLLHKPFSRVSRSALKAPGSLRS